MVGQILTELGIMGNYIFVSSCWSIAFMASIQQVLLLLVSIDSHYNNCISKD